MLDQEVRKEVAEEDLFLDDEPSTAPQIPKIEMRGEKPKAKKAKAKKKINTARLDVGTNHDEE